MSEAELLRALPVAIRGARAAVTARTWSLHADDLRQEVALRLCRYGVGGSNRLRGRSAAIDWLRRERGRPDRSSGAYGWTQLERIPYDDERDGSDALWEEERALEQMVRRILEALRPDQRELLERTYMAGITAAEYAREIGRAECTVGVKLRLARNAFEARWLRQKYARGVGQA